MLRTSYDPESPHPYVVYGRMSSDRQNPRSPEQQFSTIFETVRRLGKKWFQVGSYRDDGISGRYMRKRPGLMQMLEDITSGRVKIDLILVDTMERLGRSEEVQALRRRLFNRHGVLVLSADSQFADPTSVAGQALVFVENVRATDDNRIKAHNVLRGKLDAVRLKHWPGGEPPFGYRLESVFKEVHGRQELDYSRLITAPETAWIIRLLFDKAVETGWGPCRLATFLNQHPQIPETLRTFNFASVGLWLKSATYIGRYEWKKKSTGVIDDRRVHQHNPQETWEVVEEYCEPIVAMETWEAVQRLRRIRAQKHRRREPDAAGGKMIAPLARGLTLRYPLTGLVRCGVCGRSMIPSYSAAQNAAGQKREYVGYRCPAAATAGCENRTGVPEVWLRATVVSALLRRLRLADDWDGEGDALAEIVQLINQELQRRLAARPAIAPGLTSEREAIDRQITGWSQSLARPDLPEVVRRDLEARWAEADGRKREIDNLLSEDEAARRQSEICVDRDAVRERLNCLHEAVAGDNATLANFRLALHVDEIRGYPDGKVQMRLCKLGLLPDAEVLGERLAGPPEDQTERLLHRRRRGRLAIEGADEQEEDQLYFATDPDRFADLGDEWFWIETYQIPPRLSWSEEHARAVAEHRLATKQTMAKTAVHFGVTVPTIRAALRIAKEQFGIDAIGKELSLPTRPNWPRDNAQAVATFLSQPGMKRKDAAAHFKKSLSWIKRALDLAREQPDPEAAGGPPSGEAA